jgi:hypothetical protein
VVLRPYNKFHIKRLRGCDEGARKVIVIDRNLLPTWQPSLFQLEGPHNGSTSNQKFSFCKFLTWAYPTSETEAMVPLDVGKLGKWLPVGRIAGIQIPPWIELIGIWIDSRISSERPGCVSTLYTDLTMYIPFNSMDICAFWKEISIPDIVFLELMGYSY